MSLVTAFPASRRIAGVLVLLCLAAALPCAHGAGEKAKPVNLKKDFTTDPADELPPLHIDHGEIAGEVKKLLEREVRLARIEASVAGDLSGRLDKIGREGQERVWSGLWSIYSAAEVVGEKAGELYGFVVDGAPAVMNLYWFGSRVSTALDKTVMKRHALENKYFDLLLGQGGDNQGGGGESDTSPKTFFESGAQERILRQLRSRLDAVRRLRQEKVDSFLLARRAVDRTALPTATIERANDLWLSDVAELERLQRELKAAKERHREILADRQTKYALVKHAQKLIDECGPDEKERKESLTKKKQRLEGQLKQAEDAVEANRQKMGSLSEAIEQEKLGYDTKGGGVREETWTREKIDQLGAATSSGYAELAIRRRIMKRVTREAMHNYALAEKLGAFRRMCWTHKQREAVVEASGAYTGDKLRDAHIDQGVVSICRRERRDEDSFMGQLDYALRVVSAAKKFGEGFLRKHIDNITRQAEDLESLRQGDPELMKRKMADLRKDLRFLCDEVNALKEVGGGAFTVFLETAKSLLVVTGTYEARLEVEKTHEKIRDKRDDTEEQLKLLDDARGLGDGAVATHFGIEDALSKPWKFDSWKSKKHGTKALDLFHKDKAFHDALDGGLRRIASAGIRTRLKRATIEFLIAYEKACFTLKELMVSRDEMLGIDPETGDADYKVLLSPVRAILLGYFNLFRCLVPDCELEIEAWVKTRAAQLEGMRKLFGPLEAAEFYHPKIEASGKKSKKWGHYELLDEFPDYRRFWHKLQQENYSTEQAALSLRKRQVDKEGTYFQKNSVNTKLEVLDATQPSPKYLARAHYQDSLDQAQLWNFPSALQSLTFANELDPEVVTVEQITEAEEAFAWWETGQKMGKLASEIADQITWYLVTQGVMNQVVGKFKTALAARLNVNLPTVPPQAFSQQIGNVLKGYVNPLRNIISYETYKNQGLAAALGRMAKESVYELAEDSSKEEFLLRHLKWDQAVADRVAGLFFSVTTQMLDAAGDVGGQHVRNKLDDSVVFQKIKTSTLYVLSEGITKLKKTRRKLLGLKDPDENSNHLRDHEAGRKEIKLTEAELVKKAESELEEAIRKKTISEEEAEFKRKWIAVRKRIISEDITPQKLEKLMVELEVDFQKCQELLDKPMDAAQRERILKDCVEFVRTFEGSVDDIRGSLKAAKKAGETEGMSVEKFLDRLDVARQVIHRESFNYVTRLLQTGGSDAEIISLLKAAKVEVGGQVSPAALRELFSMISVITPTGSAGSLHRGRKEGPIEYKPWESDMDFTILLNIPKGRKVPSELRTAFEKLLDQGMVKVGDGVDVKGFDVAFMADDYGMFTGKSPDRKGPVEVMDDINKVLHDTTLPPAKRRAKLEELKTKLDKALATTRADLAHPERYRAAGRLQMLWYLTALGDHFLVVKDGQLVKRMKKDAGELSGPEAEFAKSLNAELKQWMGWEIILDDLYFAGKKAQNVSEAPDTLDRAAFTKLLKEIGKRNIRHLMGAATGDQALLKKLNDLLEFPSKGEYADHKRICEEIAKELRSRTEDTDPPLKDLADFIEQIGAYKNNPDVEALIKALGEDGKSEKSVAAALKKFSQQQNELANRCAESACKGIEKHMAETFQSRKQAEDGLTKLMDEIDGLRKDCRNKDLPPEQRRKKLNQLINAKEELKLLEIARDTKSTFIRNKLLTTLAGLKYLGGHLPKSELLGPYNKLQRDVMDAMRKAGATRNDIEEVFAELGIQAHFGRLIDRMYGTTPAPERTWRRRLDEEREEWQEDEQMKEELERALREGGAGSGNGPGPEPEPDAGTTTPPPAGASCVPPGSPLEPRPCFPVFLVPSDLTPPLRRAA